MSDDDLTAIRSAFARTFSGVGAELPAELHTRGSFGHDGWSFRYALNETGGTACLDVVAQAEGSEQIERFLASGDVESGPNFRQAVILDPDLDDDFDDAERRIGAHNDHVAAVMRERGLL